MARGSSETCAASRAGPGRSADRPSSARLRAARLRFEEAPPCIARSTIPGDLRLAVEALRLSATTPRHSRLVAESVEIELRWVIVLVSLLNFEVPRRASRCEGGPERAVRLYACANVLRGSVGTDPSEVGWPDPNTAVAELRWGARRRCAAEAWRKDSRWGWMKRSPTRWRRTPCDERRRRRGPPARLRSSRRGRSPTGKPPRWRGCTACGSRRSARRSSCSTSGFR